MFNIHINPQSLVLQSETHQAEIFLFGAILNRFAVRQNGEWRNIIAAFSDENQARHQIINGFRSAKLSPFACRLNESRYVFENTEYVCEKHVLNGHAIHGLMYDFDFKLENHGTDEQSAWIELLAHYSQENAGFPFEYQLLVKYILDETGLHIHTTATNTGSRTLPIVDGWHPYFTLGGKVDDWSLQINANQMLEFDENLLPTGKMLPESRFQTAESLRGVELDNSFVLNNQTDVSCILQSDDLILQIWAQHNYPYLQIYIPPERDCVAIENLSGAPDCFNNGLGLTLLQAAESKTFYTKYVLHQK
ncbi:aldose 1-epimerase [Alysiella filiformis]|uniref:Aldose 1-epimerase n=1 Tax=Alysiella filiformis DSM 16848 TaxID=1120981 RepID=A0A286E411_9NEIS|nr:aldose 1-epimerase [Alysiella filiformis]QMT31025.1 aldose 1-epimerase [Alysiella filiformis]UBQ55987.1 aldose 1-epimerase [Alysiella filiformis DSM 16848]SOD65645.1 aldose 1-epimerase [Alysiella filiformis DSM 16848]